MPCSQPTMGHNIPVAPTPREPLAHREEEITEQFARQFLLTTVQDGCGDLIIPAKKGHLYFDGGHLCWALVEGGPWSLKSLLRWLPKHCKEAICCEGEAIFKGIAPELSAQVVKECGAAEFVRTEAANSLNLQ